MGRLAGSAGDFRLPNEPSEITIRFMYAAAAAAAGESSWFGAYRKETPRRKRLTGSDLYLK